jgi:hypothetical protein
MAGLWLGSGRHQGIFNPATTKAYLESSLNLALDKRETHCAGLPNVVVKEAMAR